MNATPLLTAPIGRTMARLAAPNVMAMFVLLGTSMAEAWYVGQLGVTALAGLALAFPMMMLTNMLSAGAIGGAVAGAVAQRLGAGDRAGAETLAAQSVLLALLAAAAFGIVFLGAGQQIYSQLGGRGAVLDSALAYSDVLFAGAVSLWLANILSSVVRACGQMRMAAFAMMLGSAIQIVAAGVLIFGIGPFPQLGIAGAAAGVVLGFAASSVLQLVYLASGRAGLRLHWRVSLHPGPLWSMLRVGLLASISPFSSVATVIIITALVARFGDAALAGYGIGARLEFLMIPLIFGIGAASITMVGVHFGAGEIDRGHRIAWTGAIAAALITGAVGGGLALFPGLWADLFTDSAAVREACRAYLRIVGPFYAFFGLGLCLYFASQGARRVLWPVLAGLVRLAVIAVGGVLLLAGPAPRLSDLFVLIAGAMLAYGVLVAAAIRLGAWRAPAQTAAAAAR